ncbi:MAG: hypothetical protein C0467_32600 [Planctomycetaceae bacterium]|nr:hypothetical protein [Planctomycetaceae bacterium]
MGRRHAVQGRGSVGCFQSGQGEKDLGGGIVWRYKDENNYYVARFNPLEDNYRLSKVMDGKRTQLTTKDEIKVPAGESHTLAVRMESVEIMCLLDGKKLLDARTTQSPGRAKSGCGTKPTTILLR